MMVGRRSCHVGGRVGRKFALLSWSFDLNQASPLPHPSFLFTFYF